jgi:hypothetical protein
MFFLMKDRTPIGTAMLFITVSESDCRYGMGSIPSSVHHRAPTDKLAQDFC